jgi:hypothetical protein
VNISNFGQACWGIVVGLSLLSGCKNWPSSAAPAADQSAEAQRKASAAKLAQPRPPAADRSPFESTGLSSQAQEVERSLGGRSRN